MPDLFSDLSFTGVVAAFLAAALVICVAGTWLTHIADRLADRTGLGEAVTGAVLLGISTSLPGTITSITTAYSGHSDLAYANAMGGIAAQTAFLAFADCLYRRANLEHAAASVVNLTQAVLLMVLLSLALTASFAPTWTALGIHPATLVLVGAYIAGTRMAMQVNEDPMWRPVKTGVTREDTPDEEADAGSTTARMLVTFAALALVLAVAGWTVARTGTDISERAGIAESVVGALMTAVATSLPELVTTVMAVRRGALQLAVGGIIGGNTFDVLFVTASDVAYRDGSIYHAVGGDTLFWTTVAMVMTGILLLGLLRREKYGPGNVGFESVLLIAVYAAAVAISISPG